VKPSQAQLSVDLCGPSFASSLAPGRCVHVYMCVSTDADPALGWGALDPAQSAARAHIAQRNPASSPSVPLVSKDLSVQLVLALLLLHARLTQRRLKLGWVSRLEWVTRAGRTTIDQAEFVFFSFLD